MPKANKNPAKEWKTINVELVKLHLDLENFRHEPVENEEQAIQELWLNEKVEALARDIVDYGAISPLDRIGVVAMPGNPGHFIAVEGNRRVCALLLLNDPDRAPSPKDRATMRELASRTTLPRSVDVVSFPSKQDAKHWIDVRHLGPQDGQGLRPWNTTQKDRATSDGGPNKLAIAVLDRARDGQWIDSDSLPAVTTLTRYLRNREVRSALGLGHHRDLVFTHEANEVDSALQQFLRDALPTDNGSIPRVNSRSNDADRAVYARELRDRGVAPHTTLANPVVPNSAKPSKRSLARNRPDAALRKHLVPTGFVCNVDDKNLRLLFKEMQRTPIDQHEFANAYLLRALAERVMTIYLQKTEPSFIAANDQALTNRCAQLLDPTAKNSKLKALRIAASNLHSSHSLHSLGATVHAGLLMDRRALVIAWANWEQALELMIAAIMGAK